MTERPEILFACVHNAGRSQMAAAWFNLIVDPAKARAISAGTDPGTRVHPEVVEAMRERGYDLSDRVPRQLQPDADAAWADVVVTMGCGDVCPVLPGKSYVDWGLKDPAWMSLEEVRELRDEIEQRVAALAGELDSARAPSA